MSEPVVTMQAARAWGFCMRGVRAWCRRHGVDWQNARRHGVPVSTLRATGDARAARIADQAERQAANAGDRS